MKNLRILSVITFITFIAACAAPNNPEKGSYSGHAAFIERAKAGW